MPCGRMWATKAKKSYPETAESGQFWRSTLLDMDTRLRVARGIAKDETQASVEVFQTPSVVDTQTARQQPFRMAGAALTMP